MNIILFCHNNFNVAELFIYLLYWQYSVILSINSFVVGFQCTCQKGNQLWITNKPDLHLLNITLFDGYSKAYISV